MSQSNDELNGKLEGVELFCKGKKSGNYPDPERCDGFITCNEIPQSVDCPAELLYNGKTNQCDWPENVTCSRKYLYLLKYAFACYTI